MDKKRISHSRLEELSRPNNSRSQTAFVSTVNLRKKLTSKTANQCPRSISQLRGVDDREVDKLMHRVSSAPLMSCRRGQSSYLAHYRLDRPLNQNGCKPIDATQHPLVRNVHSNQQNDMITDRTDIDDSVKMATVEFGTSTIEIEQSKKSNQRLTFIERKRERQNRIAARSLGKLLPRSTPTYELLTNDLERCRYLYTYHAKNADVNSIFSVEQQIHLTQSSGNIQHLNEVSKQKDIVHDSKPVIKTSLTRIPQMAPVVLKTETPQLLSEERIYQIWETCMEMRKYKKQCHQINESMGSDHNSVIGEP